jgi:hypothetical protein
MARKKTANPIGPAQWAFNKSIKNFPFVPLNESREMSLKALESKYQNYRHVFNERIRRMTKGGSEAQRAAAAPFVTGGYKNPSTLTQMRKYAKSPEQYRRMLEKRFSELSQLFSRPNLSLQGWRATEEKTLTTLHKLNYTNIKTPEQLRAFGNYMGIMRSLWGTKEFPSDEVAEIFDLSQRNEEGRVPVSELLGRLEDNGFNVDELGVDIFG